MSERDKEIFVQANFERVLLSYCFESLENYYIVAANIDDKDFLRPEHRLIWIMMNSLIHRGASKFDGAMIINEAEKNGVLKDIGGYEYINALIGMDVDKDNVSYYVNKVLDASTKFQLYSKLQKGLTGIVNDALNEDVTSADMLGAVGKDVMDLSLKSKAVKEATNLATGLHEYIEERRKNPVQFSGLSSGFEILDRRIDGLVPGTLHVLCARPKHGKSTFLATVGAHVAFRSLKSVLCVDTEMSFDEWRGRMLSILSGVPERRVKHGGYTEQEYFNLQQAEKLIDKGKFFHEYMPGYSIEKLTAIYNKYKYVENIGLAVFDYIKEPREGNRDRKEYQIIGDVTTALKDMAGELDIPFLCANQLSREGNIADSDRVLRYADVLMFFKPRNREEIEAGGLEGGGFKLVITNSRRGGTTPEEGIGFDFVKTSLQISESRVQLIDYNSKEFKEKEEMVYDTNSEEPNDAPTEF
jgi:replicative DNA helicase